MSLKEQVEATIMDVGCLEWTFHLPKIDNPILSLLKPLCESQMLVDDFFRPCTPQLLCCFQDCDNTEIHIDIAWAYRIANKDFKYEQAFELSKLDDPLEPLPTTEEYKKRYMDLEDRMYAKCCEIKSRYNWKDLY